MRDITKAPFETYLDTLYSEENSLKRKAREAAAALGLERISLSAHEGQILKTLVKMNRPQKVVEIGTLTGLSALYIMEALGPEAKLWTLEKNEQHIEKASEIFSQTPYTKNQLELVAGDARETLAALAAQGPFDLVFIDGNKAAYLDYLDWTLANLKSGGVVVADNIYLSGAVWGETTRQKFSEKQIQVLNNFNRKLADPQFFTSAVIPTYEGLFVGVKV